MADRVDQGYVIWCEVSSRRSEVVLTICYAVHSMRRKRPPLKHPSIVVADLHDMCKDIEPSPHGVYAPVGSEAVVHINPVLHSAREGLSMARGKRHIVRDKGGIRAKTL
jgi:hypothetical protein